MTVSEQSTTTQPAADPNLVYSESQHGELVRYDRKNGEQLGIQPQIEPGEAPSHWNWDSPLLISPHSHTRLYFASQRGGDEDIGSLFADLSFQRVGVEGMMQRQRAAAQKPHHQRRRDAGE